MYYLDLIYDLRKISTIKFQNLGDYSKHEVNYLIFGD